MSKERWLFWISTVAAAMIATVIQRSDLTVGLGAGVLAGVAWDSVWRRYHA